MCDPKLCALCAAILRQFGPREYLEKNEDTGHYCWPGEDRLRAVREERVD
jgi:hypothetical protein